MKNSRKVYKFIIQILLFYIIVAGCSGTTHSSAKITLFKIPFGHADKASKNEKVKPNENTNYFPKNLGELSLFKVILNEEATSVVNKMHGKKLDECENFIAHYGSNNSKNILYVSVYENAEKTETNIKKMAMKMASGSSVYSPLTHSKMGDNFYFETKGMGLKHYFYRVDNILIWWQVEPDKAETTLSDLLKFDFAILNDKANKQ
jgi:Zn-finger protein